MANEDLQHFIEELRTRISIVDIVGAKVKLTKKGREYQGLCPFHNEKTPSFTVNESKGFYHCFGCGAHGDILKFEMEANGLPFLDALQKLSHMAGVPMPTLTAKDKEQEQEKKSLYDIMEQACLFFEKNLHMPIGAEGLKYFKEKRDFDENIIKKFRLGYAPNNNGLMAHLKSMGIDEKDLNELGLMSIPEDKSRPKHDFFRNRIMIPITNKQGKIIAFGGRVMEKIEPKYLNSPETPIFNKRRNLYNLDKAREVAYKEKQLIICEGYMDVIALDKYGFSYAVAPLGTALTEEQIIEAWKVTPEPILCLDGDAPGTKAAMRSVDRVLPILKAGYSLKFMFLPDNMDPDEYLKCHGAESFKALMNKTKPLIDILWQKYTQDENANTPERKALIEKTLLEEVAKIKDQTVRGYYSQEIKNRIYLAYKQSAWSKDKANNTQQPAPQNTQAKVAPAPQQVAPIVVQNTYQPRTNNYNKSNKSYPNKNNNQRQSINHNISTPDALRQKAYSENDINFGMIIAAQLIYPELIDDFEEQIFTDDIKDENLKKLYQTILNTYHDEEAAISGEDFQNLIYKNHPSCGLKDLWQFEMLKKRTPFINELKKLIEKLLAENKLRTLDEEIKNLSNKLSQNFSEEDYLHLNSIKKERDEILAHYSTLDNE